MMTRNLDWKPLECQNCCILNRILSALQTFEMQTEDRSHENRQEADFLVAILVRGKCNWLKLEDNKITKMYWNAFTENTELEQKVQLHESQFG